MNKGNRRKRSHNMAPKLWDITNYVTGFAVAQGIAVAIAFGSNQDMLRAIQTTAARIWIMMAIIIAAPCYCLVIAWCHRNLGYSGEDHRIAKTVAIGQMTAICFFHSIMLLPLGFGLPRQINVTLAIVLPTATVLMIYRLSKCIDTE
jgi:hypothetical protein